MADLSSRVRMAGVVTLGVLAVAGAFFVLRTSNDLREASSMAAAVHAKRLIGLSVQGDLQYATQESRRLFLYALTTRDVDEQLVFIEKVRKADVMVDLLVGRSILLRMGEKETAMLEQFAENWLRYGRTRDDIIALTLQGRIEEALHLENDEASQEFDAALALIRTLKATIEADAAEEQGVNTTLFHRTSVELTLLLAVTLVVIASLIGAVYRMRDAKHLAEHEREQVQIKNAEIAQLCEKAHQASEAKSSFLANMSHEIRTPMNAIMGLVSLLLRSPLNDEQRKYLQLVMSSSENLLRVINDILDFSKIEAGRLDLHEEPFHLPARFDNLLKTLAPAAEQKGIELLFRLDPEVPEWITADGDRLEQIAVNLVGNAIKFTSRGEVEVRLSASGADPQSERLRISVRDTGIGIAPDRQQAIFEAFTQADAKTTRRFGGTGLGLTISSRLVEIMRGRIWVESELGKGTTFYVEIPMVGPLHEPLLAEPLLAGRQAAIAEPNASSRAILADLLKRWGIEAACFVSVSDAIDWLRATPEAALLLVARAGELGPFCRDPVLTQGIHKEKVALPVIVLGPVTQEEPCPYPKVAKPIYPPDLRAKIVEALAGAQAIPAASEVTRAETASGAGRRVLVAEDNPINQLVARLFLEARGYAVALAKNGEEVLELLDRQFFDLILMDVHMPNLDGFETTAAIRRRESGTGRRTCILALTALAVEGDRERCLAAGMDAYLSKPITAERLWEAVDSFVGSLREDEVSA